jgi:hypothetical protein
MTVKTSSRDCAILIGALSSARRSIASGLQIPHLFITASHKLVQAHRSLAARDINGLDVLKYGVDARMELTYLLRLG